MCWWVCVEQDRTIKAAKSTKGFNNCVVFKVIVLRWTDRWQESDVDFHFKPQVRCLFSPSRWLYNIISGGGGGVAKTILKVTNRSGGNSDDKVYIRKLYSLGG